MDEFLLESKENHDEEQQKDNAIKAGQELVKLLMDYCAKNAGDSDFLLTYIDEIKNGTGEFNKQKKALDSLTGTGEKIGIHAKNLADSYEKNSVSVEKISTTFTTLNGKITDVDASLKASTKDMQTLSEQVKKITTYTETIEEISAQTNLLSFNASIEAARAGAAGKGFRIIANEVKKLSESTRSTSQEIAHMVSALSEKIDLLQVEQENHTNMLQSLIAISEESRLQLLALKNDELHNSDNAREVISLLAENNKNIEEAVSSIKTNEEKNAQKIQNFADKTSESSILFNDLISFVIEINEVFNYLKRK